jgi:hypothetical membrane protein
MKPLSKRIETFHERYPLVGPAFWIASIQFFITMLVAALAWPTVYSFLNNTISDLGNTVCGTYNARYVCSPDNVLMNISFSVLGITMALGSILIYREFRESRASAVGFSFMALAGVGTLMVGLFSENHNSGLHSIGAFLPFVIGNLSLLILGYCLAMPRNLRIYTIASGAVSLTAALLFISHTYLGLGVGGMERLAANLQTVWLIVFGIYISKNR